MSKGCSCPEILIKIIFNMHKESSPVQWNVHTPPPEPPVHPPWVCARLIEVDNSARARKI